jgi:hypothetical protein
MNTCIINSSLKYLKEYKVIIKLARWIYEEATIINYNDYKFEQAGWQLDKEIIKCLIPFVQDKYLEAKYIFRFIDDYEIVKLFLQYGACVCYEEHDLLEHAINNSDPNIDIIELLLEYGADPTNNDFEVLVTAYSLKYYNIVKILLKWIDKNCDLKQQQEEQY